VAREVLPILRERGLLRPPTEDGLTFREALFGTPAEPARKSA